MIFNFRANIRLLIGLKFLFRPTKSEALPKGQARRTPYRPVPNTGQDPGPGRWKWEIGRAHV